MSTQRHRHATSLAARTAVILGAVGFTAGCAIPYSDPSTRTAVNRCSTDDECGAGAVCRDERCTGTEVDLTGMILAVRPNSGASFGASTSFLIDPGDTIALHTSDPSGYSVELDAKLPTPIPLTEGKVHLEYASTCPLAADKSFPATIRFDRVTDFTGFHFDSFTATAEKSKASMVYAFDASVFPGVYDVYIQPLPIPGCENDTPPPVFYPKQVLKSADDTPNWGVIKPTLLKGEIQIPEGGDLTDFRLDLVEPTGGRVVSTTQTLAPGDVPLSVPVHLAFSWADTTTSPYIRLRPPEGVAMPSVYWGLFESLKSLSDPEVHLSVQNLKVAPRIVEIQVQDADHHGVSASVRVQSLALSGEVAKNAAYSIDDGETDEKGFFKTLLPPGDYRVRVTPNQDDSLAISERDIKVPVVDPSKGDDPSVCICGQVVTAQKRTELSGKVVTPTGRPLGNAPIDTDPSQPAPVSYWNKVHALDAALPRSTTSLTDDQGLFRLGVDQGASDLSVRPPAESGFPWLVHPRVTVQLADNAVQLDPLAVSNPAVLHGAVLDPSGAAVANVVIDAWLPLRDPSAPDGLTGTVIQIGTTISDENGRYTLLLPAMLASP
ncbi:MAG: hypothetical protein U0359_09865 [Byssovorax sp.]